MPPRGVLRGSPTMLVTAVASACLITLLTIDAYSPPALPGSSVPSGVVPPGSSRPTTLAPNETILPMGTLLQIVPAGFQDVMFELTLTGHVSGSFRVAGGVAAFIVNPDNFAQFESTGSASAYACRLAVAPTGAFDATVPSGTWYLVFSNLGSSTVRVVEVTSAIQAEFPVAASSGANGPSP